MILIADGDLEEIRVLQTLLKEEFPLLIANHRQEAWDLARVNPIKGAILRAGKDITEAYDLIQGLIDLRKEIPIFLIFDEQSSTAVAPLIQAGIIHPIEEPFDPPGLISKVRQCVHMEKRIEEPPSGAIPPGAEDLATASLSRGIQKFDPVSMDQLMMVLAHRLKNPLVAIRTFTHLLPERFNDPQFQKDFYQVMRQEVERMDSLIDQLIEFSELPEPSSMSQPILPLLKEGIKRATERFRGRSIPLEDRLDNKTIMVDLDREQFIYALIYLLKGLQHPEEKSRQTRISARIREADHPNEVEILLQKRGTMLMDQGQLSGLELFIAKRMIERQHGQIQWDIFSDGNISVRVLFPYAFTGTAFSPEDSREQWKILPPLYTDRRKAHLTINFRDRRVSQRRFYRRPSYFPERRRTTSVTALP